jgi:hypothetical protein
MSDNTERPESETPPTTPPRAEAAAAGGGTNGQTAPHDPTAELKRNLEAYHLTPEQKEALLAELPAPEEMERMYRELQEKGGLSFEEFFEPLLREFGSQS